MKNFPGWTRSKDGDTLEHTSGAKILVRDRDPRTGTPTRVQWFALGDWGTCNRIGEAVDRANARLEKTA